MRKRVRIVGAAAVSVGAATGLLLSSMGGTAVAGHENKILQSTLTGAKEVGKKGDKDGRGTISIFGIDKDPKTLCYVLKVDGIKLAPMGMAGHIHRGGPRENGPVVVNLAAPGDGDAGDCLTQGEKTATNAKVFDKATVSQILQNPGDFYVNVHNKQFPDGALRGQLRAVN